MPHLMQLSAPLQHLQVPAEQAAWSFLGVGEQRGAAVKEMTEGAGCPVLLHNGLTFLCCRPLSRVMEEKPVIQEAATEPESSGMGLFFGCVFTVNMPCWELGWAAASPFFSHTFIPLHQMPDGEVEWREVNCLRCISRQGKDKKSKCCNLSGRRPGRAEGRG